MVQGLLRDKTACLLARITIESIESIESVEVAVEKDMAGKTISAYTDAETSDRVANLARLEHRKKAQIAGTALKFYVGLPAEARAAWQEIEAIGSAADCEETLREITRTLLHAKYRLAHQLVMSHMKVEGLDQLETEDDILSAAVALTR